MVNMPTSPCAGWYPYGCWWSRYSGGQSHTRMYHPFNHLSHLGGWTSTALFRCSLVFSFFYPWSVPICAMVKTCQNMAYGLQTSQPNWKSFQMCHSNFECSTISPSYGGFLKWGYPQCSSNFHQFPLWTIHFRIPPFIETPISLFQQATFKGPPSSPLLVVIFSTQTRAGCLGITSGGGTVLKDLADIKPGCRSSNPQKNMRHLRMNPEMELEIQNLGKIWIGQVDWHFCSPWIPWIKKSHFRFHLKFWASKQESSPPSPLESEFKKASPKFVVLWILWLTATRVFEGFCDATMETAAWSSPAFR